MLIPSAKKGPALIDEMRGTDTGPGLALWWLGQSGFLVKHGKSVLLFDPYLSDSLTVKYAQTDKPHVRMTEIPVHPEQLDFVDVVTSSHNHTDHLDGETLGPLWRANPNLDVVVPEANREFAANRLGVDPSALHVCDAGKSCQFGEIALHGVPSAHELVDRDEQGRCHYLGLVARLGDWTLYHPGDTVLYEGMVDELAPFDIDVAFLPINGRKKERRVSGNLWGREAAQLAKDIGASLVIPCHYDMFTFNTESPREFEETCATLGQEFRTLRCGELLSLT